MAAARAVGAVAPAAGGTAAVPAFFAKVALSLIMPLHLPAFAGRTRDVPGRAQGNQFVKYKAAVAALKFEQRHMQRSFNESCFIVADFLVFRNRKEP